MKTYMPVETSLGEVRVCFPDPRTIYAQFGPSTFNGERDHDPLMVNDVPVLGSIRLTNYGNGFELTRDREDNPASTWGAVYAHRADKFLEDISRAAHLKIAKVLGSALAAWAAERPELVKTAEHVERKEKRAALQRDIKEARAALSALEAELRAL